MALCELTKVLVQFHEICSLLYVVMEGLHLVVGLFAEDEQCYLVVGVDVVYAVDVGGHEFEDEHYVVTSVQVQLFIPLDSLLHLPFLFGLFLHFLYFCFFCHIDVLEFAHFAVDCVHQVGLYFDFSLVELFVLFEVDL